MTPLAIALALVALIGLARTLWWQRKSPAPWRPWRLAVLVTLQIITATLLWLALEPPEQAGGGGTLAVATAGTSPLAALAAGDTLVALPEAPPLPGATREPDLATALRHHPGTRRLRILGNGLPPRDRFATNLPVLFDVPRLPRGLVSLIAPPPVAPGAAFRVSGTVKQVPGGRAELIDPAGRIVAGAPLAATGAFTLSATAGAAGPAEFALRISDRNRQNIETALVPVVATEAVQPRVLILSGAAGPDLKYLRRWATDAGLAIGSSIAAGNGLDIGDTPPRLDAASLARLDLLVLDERSWAAIGQGARAQVLGAVRNGLGVVLRITGPVAPATQRDWAALGFAIDDATGALRLPGETTPLTQMASRASRDAAPLLRAANGQAVAHWRALGRGRIGLWPVTDLYTIVLAGGAARHAAIWSAVFATVARPQSQPVPRISGDAGPGQRITICDAGLAPSVRHPDGAITNLVVDAGCAGFWPRAAGWHELRTGNGEVATPFMVMPIGPARAAAQARSATIELAGQGMATSTAAGTRGPSWPWLLAWAGAAALLWWFERSRFGRTPPA